MTLQKLIHSQEDIVTDEGSNTIIIHGVNEIINGGEFTICGRAIPDSVLSFDGWEKIGENFKGSIRKCECKDCLRIIQYYKRLK